MKLTKQKCEQWIAALRSGEYRQTRGTLKRGNQHGSFYCCLGVAEEVLGALRADQGVLSTSFLPVSVQRTLIRMNDGSQKGFDYIAGWIETELLPECPDE